MVDSTTSTPPDAASSSQSLADFLDVLFDPFDLIELRPLRHDGERNPPQQWLTPVELAELDTSAMNADELARQFGGGR